MPPEDRNFTDADIRRAMEILFEYIDQQIGKGIRKALWSSLLALLVGAAALGLAIKFQFVSAH